MPIVSMTFECIRVDIVDPLTSSSGKHWFFLVVVDYATQHPEAMPLRTAMATAVAYELATLFTRVGFPKQIVTDQGTMFVGNTLKTLAQLVGLQALQTTVYHPQTNGLVECFNGTLKMMLHNHFEGAIGKSGCPFCFLR